MYLDPTAPPADEEAGFGSEGGRAVSVTRIRRGADPAAVTKTLVVGFPVLLPGDPGQIVPFGRYDLVVSAAIVGRGEGQGKAALVAWDGGTPIALTAGQLDALFGSPDVEAC